mmetsp:Transcript_2379/g.3517  ORF Transcript_2379/g.3517 Transcript_2379/m.3517 type:complete len:481 (-) Transcript_2379:97-1539(-)
MARDPEHQKIVDDDEHINLWEAYFILLLLGATCILPWNVLVAAADYFNEVYDGLSPEFWFGVFNFGPLLFGLVVMNLYGRSWDLHWRIQGSLAAYILGLCAILGSDSALPVREEGPKMTPEDAAQTAACFTVLLCVVFLFGAATAVLQSSLFGLAGVMGPNFTQAVHFGMGFGALATTVTRVLAKYCVGEFGVQASAQAFFGVAGAVVGLSSIFYKRFRRLPAIRRRLRIINAAAGFPASPRTDQKDQKTYSAIEDKASGDPLPEEKKAVLQTKEEGPKEQREAVQDDKVAENTQEVVLLEVAYYARVPLLTIFLCYTVCLTMYPGVVTSIPSRYGWGSWFPVLNVATFSLGDFLGKGLPRCWRIFPPHEMDRLGAAIALQGLVASSFFLILAACDGDDPLVVPCPPGGADNWCLGLSLMLGFCTGYMGTSCMMLAPEIVPGPEKEAAGFLGTLCLSSGLFLGSVVGLMFSKTTVEQLNS